MTIVPITGQGVGATATATQSTGSINAATVTAGGSGYVPGSTVTLVITGSTGGSGAVVTALVNAAGAVTTGAATIGTAGTGYSGTITAVVNPSASNGGPAIMSAAGVALPSTGVDISGLTTSIVWCIDVLSLTALKTASISLELTVNAFTAVYTATVENFLGAIGQGGVAPALGVYNPTTDKRSRVIRIQLPFAATNYFGIANARARVNLNGLDASAAIMFDSWLEVG